jgi:hypothetical protein
MAHFAPRMRSLHIRGDVSLMNIPAYTQAMYTRGKAEYMDNDWIYKSFLTSLRTYISAEKWKRYGHKIEWDIAIILFESYHLQYWAVVNVLRLVRKLWYIRSYFIHSAMPRIYVGCVYAEIFISNTSLRIHSLRIRSAKWAMIRLTSGFQWV